MHDGNPEVVRDGFDSVFFVLVIENFGDLSALDLVMFVDVFCLFGGEDVTAGLYGLVDGLLLIFAFEVFGLPLEDCIIPVLVIHLCSYN